MKGIILAGGRGTRLHPVTLGLCKQLLPVYDKPMIYYPLSVLMMAGIRDILIISTPDDLPRFQRIFGDGSQLGLQFSYLPQPRPEGIAQAFLIGEEFIGEESVGLVLGDNIFYGHALPDILTTCCDLEKGAMIFGYEVKDPERYGVVAFDSEMKVTSIVEKPIHPASRYAVTGLYFYDNDVVEIARHLKPSDRAEYEITDVNMVYLQRGDLCIKILDRGFAWLDTGTPEALQQASNYVQTIQMRQGIKIGCIEEIAYRMGFIDAMRLKEFAEQYAKSEYGAYLAELTGTPLALSCCTDHPPQINHLPRGRFL
jgi:glucose-1-phosphate thymidylyltransferase